MSPDILVATPQAAVGELLRLSLEESRQYRVRMVQSGHEALAAASRIPFDLAILDATLSDQTVATLMRSLVGQRASLKLVVIPPENDPAKLEPNGLRPDATLNLPFYAPDLVELVNSLLQGAPTKEASKDIPIADQACDRFNKNP